MEIVNKENIPRHIGVIMDGNRKWAKANNKSISEGYLEGRRVFEEVCLYCLENKIPYLSTFAFSIGNLERSNKEIRALLDLVFEKFQNAKWFIDNNIRIYFAGALRLFTEEEQRILQNVSMSTSKCDGLTVTVALNYDGQEELLNALNQIIKQRNEIKSVTKDTINQYLYTSHLPDLDLVIRTANIQRLTRFLLWKSSYTECVFIKKYWPEFTKEDFIEAVNEYGKRERRYGK